MKKWKCTVCGYIHTGDDAPDTCPVCGAPKNRFVEVNENGAPITAPTAAEKAPTPAAGQKQRQWKCSVCGYTHTGDDAPDKCPVCGAPRNRFVDLAEDAAPAAAPAAPARAATTGPRLETDAGAKASEETARQDQAVPPEPRSRFAASTYRVLFEMLTKYHGHPISVHIPNGLLPIAVLFIFSSAIFGFKGMLSAAVYNLGVVAFAMPLVLFTGWVDWQNRFNGAITQVFTVKIACGIIVTVTAWFLFIWLLVNPEVVTTSQASRVAFFMINLIMLGAAGTAGWYGGKLVFRD